MSFKLTPSAHKKKRLVINTNGRANRRSVRGADVEEDVEAFPAEVITMAKSAPDRDVHTRHPRINVAPSRVTPATTAKTRPSRRSLLPPSSAAPVESSKQSSAAFLPDSETCSATGD